MPSQIGHIKTHHALLYHSDHRRSAGLRAGLCKRRSDDGRAGSRRTRSGICASVRPLLDAWLDAAWLMQVRAIASEIAALISASTTSTIVRQCGAALRAAQAPTGGSRQGNVAGGMLRLAFHDAVTFVGAGSAGGFDGCIDLTDKAANGGLEQTVALLDCVRANSSARALGAFSRADLWALAGSTAAVVTMPSATSGNVAISFRSGRVDNPNCAATDKGRFPNAEGDLASVLAISQRLGLTQQEMVALMGAHSLGRAELGNSGYNGAWTQDEGSLDGQRYYSDLVTQPWTKTASGGTSPTGTALHQWEHGREIMLTTDIALAFTTTANAADGTRCGGGGGGAGRRLLQAPRPPAGRTPPTPPPTVQRTQPPTVQRTQPPTVQRVPPQPPAPPQPAPQPNGNGGAQCNAAATRSFVDMYRQAATGQALWARDFAAAFAKLIELGQSTASLGPAFSLSAASIGGSRRSATRDGQAVAADEAAPEQRIAAGSSAVSGMVFAAAVALLALVALAIVVHRRRRSASLAAAAAAAAAALPMSSARLPLVSYPLAVLIGADSVPAAIETAAAHSGQSDIVETADSSERMSAHSVSIASS